MTSRRGPLVIGAAGAIVVLLGFLGDIAELVGVAAIVVGTLLASPSRGRWWKVMRVGAAISVVALPLSLLLETPGGLLAGVGAGLVLVAVAFDWPAPRA